MRYLMSLFLVVAFAGYGFAADSLTLGGTAPGGSLSAPTAGNVFAAARDTSSTISYSTDSTIGARKITVEIDDTKGNLPAGTRAQVTASPGVGQGDGYTVTLSTIAGDLVRNILGSTTATGLPLTFEFTASLEAAPTTDSRTIRYTILMQ